MTASQQLITCYSRLDDLDFYIGFVLDGKDLLNNNDALLNVHVELEKTYLNFSKASGLMAAPSMIRRTAFSKCMICQVESEHHKRWFCDPIDDRTSIAI